MSVNPLETVVGSNQPNPSPEPSGDGGQPIAPDYSQNALYQKTGGDWDKARQSYFNAVNELQKQHTANQDMAQRVQMLEQMVTAAAGGQATVNQDPLAEIAALGVPVAPINSAIDQRAQKVVEQVLQNMLGPIAQQMQAEETLQSEIEGFDEHKRSARAYMRENPDVQAVFDAIKTTKPVEAWKYAIRETLFARTQQGNQGQVPQGAMLPGGGSPAGRGAPNEDAQSRAMRESQALDYGRKFGDMGPYRAERFKGTSVERAVRNAMRQAGYMIPGEQEDRGW